MTCVIGIEDENGQVFMGADSASVGAKYQIDPGAETKVFRNGEFTFGVSGSWRLIQILKYSFAPRPIPKGLDHLKYLCTIFLEDLRGTLASEGFLSESEGYQSIPETSTALIGYRGRLYYLGDDLQISRTINGYDVIGCGKMFALGSLYSTSHWDKSMGLSSSDRLEEALQAATHHSAGVIPPYVFVNTPSWYIEKG